MSRGSISLLQYFVSKIYKDKNTLTEQPNSDKGGIIFALDSYQGIPLIHFFGVLLQSVCPISYWACLSGVNSPALMQPVNKANKVNTITCLIILSHHHRIPNKYYQKDNSNSSQPSQPNTFVIICCRTPNRNYDFVRIRQ